MKNKHQVTFIPWRFYLIILVILLVVAGLIARLVDLTVIDRGFLKREGDVRTRRVINTLAFRGMITDRHGYPLAVSTSVYSVWVNPQELEITPQQLKSLAEILSIDATTLQKQIDLSKAKDREFVYLKRGISPELAEHIKKLMIPGVAFQEDSKRFYPEGEIAAHVVGFTNIDDKGQEGLELAYNDWLTGTPGKKLVIKDRLGRVVSDLQTIQQQKSGNDLTLSIDRKIQYLAYRELAEGIAKNIASAGTVVVLDVKTGEILAMVNLPSYNPNNRPDHASEVYRNSAITDSFEPGSTIKAFSIATALDSGLYKPETMIETTPGWMRVERHVVRDEHNEGTLSVAQILQLSSNVGTTKIVLSLPPDKLWSVLHRIGFGEITGVGFPGEQSGSLVKRPIWRPFAIATLSFGYGISVTPLQLAQAYSIFANGGNKVPVSLLKRDKPPTMERVMDEKTANQMLALLETVTTATRASGKLARVSGYRVAGKTGTALMAGIHGYQKHHYISTFVGIAPVSNPRLVVAVIIRNPQGKFYYASDVSAPIFERIMEGALRILNVSPDDMTPA